MNVFLYIPQLAHKVAEEEAKKDRIVADNEAKTNKLRQLTMQLEKLRTDQNSELRGSEGETSSYCDEKNELIEKLNATKEKCLITLESYPIIERENSALRQTVNGLNNELTIIKSRHSKELKDLHSEMFDFKMKVELEFRKTKRSLEEQYKKKAHETMKDESDKAILECQRLNGILNVKRDEVVEKMRKQNAMEAKLTIQKISRDIESSTVEMQEGEVELLERLIKEQEVVVSRSQSSVAELHIQMKSMQMAEKMLLESAEKLSAVRAECAKAESEKNSWQSRVSQSMEKVEKLMESWRGMEGGGNIAGNDVPEGGDDDEEGDEGDCDYIWKTSAASTAQIY